MKRLFLLVFAFCVLSNSGLKAQKSLSFNTYYKVKERKNIVKIGLPALFFNNVHIKYQRAINKKFSFQISWAKYFETDLVKRFEGKSYKFLQYTADFENYNEGNFYGSEVTVPELKFTGFYTQAEFRYHFTKRKWLTGYYVGPYYSYHLNFLNNVRAYDDLGFDYTGYVDLQIFNAGIQTGYQVLIKKFLSIDFHFLGLGWLWAKHNFMFTTNNNNLEYYKINEDLINTLSTDLNFSSKDYETSTFEKGLAYSLKRNLPMLRTGISIGILF